MSLPAFFSCDYDEYEAWNGALGHKGLQKGTGANMIGV